MTRNSAIDTEPPTARSEWMTGRGGPVIDAVIWQRARLRDMTEPIQFKRWAMFWMVAATGTILAGCNAIQCPGHVRKQLKSNVEELGGKMWIANNGSVISMNGTSVTDSDVENLASLVRKCDIWLFDLSNTQITDKSIPVLETLVNRNIQINLDSTAVSDNGKLRVGGIRISHEQAVKLLGFDPNQKPSPD